MLGKTNFWFINAFTSFLVLFDSLPPSTSCKFSGSESSLSESCVTLDSNRGWKILSLILSYKGFESVLARVSKKGDSKLAR